MEITPVAIGVRILPSKQDEAVSLLSTNDNVRFLWRTYGDNDLVVVAFCDRGREGEIIQDIRASLETLKAERIDVSVGFTWEKMNCSPFNDLAETEKKLVQFIENP